MISPTPTSSSWDTQVFTTIVNLKVEMPYLPQCMVSSKFSKDLDNAHHKNEVFFILDFHFNVHQIIKDLVKLCQLLCDGFDFTIVNE